MEENFVNPVRGQQPPGEIKKIETSNGVKITNALYRVLDFLPEQDPLKNRAKEKALAILENVTLVSGTEGWTSLQKEKASAQLLDDIGILQNYLKIGKHQGWIDTVNFLIITKEYDAIKSAIEPPKGLIKGGLEIGYRVLKPDTKPAHEKEPSRSEPVQQPIAQQGPPMVIGKYSQRQEKILDVLAHKQKAQVSDLIKELPNITKRTVRRDLDDLLKRGKIVRVGAWNQVFYTLANNGKSVDWKVS